MLDKIICFGEILWDMLPTGAQPGGAPLNVAVHLKKQGFSPLLISKTGKDDPGEELLNFIGKSGLQTDLIFTDDKLPTSQVLVHLDVHKNATYEICEPVAWDNLQPADAWHEAAAEAELIIFGSLASRNSTTRNTLLQLLSISSAIRLLDINLRPPYVNPETLDLLLQHSDFLKLNEEELVETAVRHNIKGTTEDLTRWIADCYGCQLVCVTRGAEGAILLYDNNIYRHPGFRITAVDTVGAGDSFLAALVAGLAKNMAPDAALEYACATGALVASREGAVPEYAPEEVEQIITGTGL